MLYCAQDGLRSSADPTRSDAGTQCLRWEHTLVKIPVHREALYTSGQFSVNSPPENKSLGVWRKLENPEKAHTWHGATSKTQVTVSRAQN